MDGTRRARQSETDGPVSFEGLIRRYQDMAFGYALSLLRDYHLAQDATQEALFIAYMNLPTLRERAAFPGWLRGIVHHQCCRYLRKRRFDTIPLDDAIGVPEAAIGPAQYLERREALDHILAAIGALPDAQREVAALYYIKDYAQREIAAFLDVPVSTVNNRLHAARQQLRGELRPMTEHTTTTTAVTPPMPPIGQVIRVQGPIVDAQFADGALPGLMGRATITDEASGLLDAMTYTSYALGVLGIYPAVDPLLSWSRHLDPTVVGQEHYNVALGVRRLLRRYREIQEDGLATRADEDKRVVARARRVQRFFTQPFAVAESFTGRAGQSVSRADTVRGFKALLEGAYDGLPEDAFLWCGPIEQAIEHARAPRA